MPIQLFDADTGEMLEGMHYEDFANPNDPEACQMLLAMNPYSTIINTCGYGAREITWKLMDAAHDARENGVELTCTCEEHEWLTRP